MSFFMLQHRCCHIFPPFALVGWLIGFWLIVKNFKRANCLILYHVFLISSIAKNKALKYNKIMKKIPTINILGINVSFLKKNEIKEKIEKFLTDGVPRQIVTPNPEIILRALEDEELFFILNNTDLAIADGMGLKIAAFTYGKNLERITGADLLKDILKLAEEKNLKAAIFNWKGSISNNNEIEIAVKKFFPELELTVETINRDGKNFNFQKINEFKPDIIFTNLGAPFQEKFIFHNLKKMPSVKLGIGVGGGFDYLTGKLPRAPFFIRYIGLEWLWRLILEPKRIKRIYNAVFVFSWKFLKWRFILPFLYRPNVACLLFKRDGGKIKILLVQRSDQENHWQLPQGGTDGEKLEKAGEREIREEIGTDKFKIIACYGNLYKYKFKDKLSKYNLPYNNTVGYKGQKQGLCVAEFLGQDADIKINFWDHKAWKWVDSGSIISEVHAYRKEPAEIFLEKFNGFIKA